MKKFVVLIVLCLTFLPLAPVSAQQNASRRESEYYYVTVPIEKVYAYRKGYVVMYRKSMTQMGTVYLPLEWFHTSAGKAEFIPQSTGTDWPHLTVYYKSGEFSHVRLYARRDATHETWGSLSAGTNIDDRFENVTGIKLEFE